MQTDQEKNGGALSGLLLNIGAWGILGISLMKIFCSPFSIMTLKIAAKL